MIELRHKLLLAWILMGFTSMIGQIVLMRELIYVFYGNELALGTTLACWLLWVGIGSFGLGRLVDRVQDRLRLLIMCEVLLAFLLPLSILAVRSVKLILGFSAGEIIGIFPMLYSCLLLLPPLCLTLGFTFALNCKILSSTLRDAVKGIGRVYIFEATGSAIAGVMFSYLLVRWLTHLQIALIVSLFAFGVGFLLALERRGVLRTAVLLLLVVLAGGLGLGGAGRVDEWSNSLRWKGFNPIHSEDSIYGNLTVTKYGDQVSMFESGLLMFTYPDLFSSEEVVHYPMLSHPDPKSVLLIGGGIGGALEEILKYGVESVDYLELDPLVVELSRRYVPAHIQDPRLKVFNMDGRYWVKRTRQKYDVVIVNLPEPFTAQLNRFFTQEFYDEIRRILTPSGVLSFRLTSHENYISDELAQFLASIRSTLLEVFGEVRVIPGDTNVFLVTANKGILSTEPSFFVERLKERGVETRYVRGYYINSRLSRERVDYLNGRVAEGGAGRINRDLQPISYYYDIVLWSTHFQSAERRILSFLSGLKVWHIAAGFLALLLLLQPIVRKIERAPVLVAVGTTGSAEIVMEVMTLLAFQTIYGYVYYKIGIILTAFMVGLTLGALHMTRRLESRDVSVTAFLKIQTVVCVYPLLLLMAFMELSRISGWRYSAVSVELGFPLLTAVAGFVGGLQFPLANKLYLEKRGEVGRVAGMTYGVDLFGACVGAVFSSAILIPILGIPNTCFVVAALNGVALILVAQKVRRYSAVKP